MFKNSFLILAMLFATNVATHAQNADGVTKSLSMYLCGGTGNINPDTGKIMDHWGEAGVNFSQNFADAQWLTIKANFGICTAGAGLVTAPDQDGNDVWVADDANQKGSLSGGYLSLDVGFAGYFNLGLHSQGRLEFEARYPILLPANQKIVLSTAFEVRPLGNLFYDTAGAAVDTGAADNGQVLGFMKYEILYAIQFHPEWSYTTDAEFRFNGASVLGEKNDSMEAVKNSFGIRWNHVISYNNPNGFGGYFAFRYEPTNILVAGADIVHNIKLYAGVSYSYDLSAL